MYLCIPFVSGGVVKKRENSTTIINKCSRRSRSRIPWGVPPKEMGPLSPRNWNTSKGAHNACSNYQI